MTKQIISISPYQYNFLYFFDHVLENGDFYFNVSESYNNIVPRKIYDSMIASGFSIFGITSVLPEFLNKIKFQIIPDNETNKKFIFFQLAPCT